MSSETIFLNYYECCFDQKILSSERGRVVHKDLDKS